MISLYETEVYLHVSTYILSVSLTPEEIDHTLYRLESGVDVALQRAKAWTKYAKDVVTYVEKKLHYGMFAPGFITMC